MTTSIGPAPRRQVADIVEPAFVEESADVVNEGDFDVVARSAVRLDDVSGMADVKQQIELSLLGPIRNPELMKAYKVSARGGLLLYGPPGCGKTYIAKAISGELGANFYQVGIADVLHRWFGESERSIRSVFDNARRNAPCVLFFDEVDALGHRRSALSGSSGHAHRRQRPTGRDRLGHVDQRRRLCARRHQRTLGCRPGDAAAGTIRPDGFCGIARSRSQGRNSSAPT